MNLETKIRRFREGKDLFISGEEWSQASLNNLLCAMIGCRNEPKWRCPTCKHTYCNEHREIHQRIHPIP